MAIRPITFGTVYKQQPPKSIDAKPEWFLTDDQRYFVVNGPNDQDKTRLSKATQQFRQADDEFANSKGSTEERQTRKTSANRLKNALRQLQINLAAQARDLNPSERKLVEQEK